MPAVLDTLKIVTINPPTMLPTIYVTVRVGETKVITRAMVNAAQTYYQSQGVPLGSINIVNFHLMGVNQGYSSLLSQTNNSNTLAYFSNLGNRIYRTTNAGPITNGYLTKNTIDIDRFTVTGVKIGTSGVKYRATAHNGTLESASTMSVLGIIVINVIGPNQKPNALSGGVQDVIWDSLSTIMGSTVTNNYADPENDDPYMVKITTLPTKGTLYYQGEAVILNQEIPYAQIQAGMLVYDNNGSISTIGSTDTFRHTVSDTGSQQFY